MPDKLFIELSDEQQELISGGLYFDCFENVDSSYSLKGLKLGGIAMSGPNGSYSASTFDAVDINSTINKLLKMNSSTPT
jgi:hypothetical protein